MVVYRVFRLFEAREVSSSLGFPALLLRLPRRISLVVVGLDFLFLFDPCLVSSLAPHPTKDKTRKARSFISLCRAYARTLATNQGRGATRAILRLFLSKGFSGVAASAAAVVAASLVSSSSFTGGPIKILSVHSRTQILNRWGR